MKDNWTVAVAQLGARMHYAVPRIFFNAGQLDRLYTDICVAKGWPRLANLIPLSLRPSGVKRLLGRLPEGIPSDRIVAFNWLGLEYVWRRHGKLTSTQATAISLWADDRIGELILRYGLGEADAIYGFNTGCSNLYRRAKQLGKKIILEQYCAPRLIDKRLLRAELTDSGIWGEIEEDKLEGEVVQREQESWHLADIILCGSEFVRQGVVAEGGPIEKCVVVPYGVDLSAFDIGERDLAIINRPIKVLFVGGVGPRKGVRYLLEAIKKLEGLPVQCRIVGGWQVPLEVIRRQTPPNVELVGLVPRAEMKAEFAWADIFCLPSLCEGSATVIYEALAAGLPVITTYNAGSIVRDGQEGFIVPIQDSNSIADSIERLTLDRTLLYTMSGAARERSKVGSFEAYSQRLLHAVKEMK